MGIASEKSGAFSFYIMEKQLFIIDGYRIWAHTYEEAQQQYQMILKF